MVGTIKEWTPNALIPKGAEKITNGRLSAYDASELYLAFRFLLALVLAIGVFPKSVPLTYVVGFIQISSLIYLLGIVFPIEYRNLNDPQRSLFFAFGHYIEIGLSMGYVYWCIGTFNDKAITLFKSVYFSFVTMMTIGYGDITPDSNLTRGLIIIHSIVGVFMVVTVIGLFLSLSSVDRPPKD